MEACLPDDKFNRAREIVNSFTQRRSVRLFELQSLVGTLQFACKGVVPGRTFLQKMINLTKGVPSRFHHIWLNKEFLKDLKMWKAFLADWNGHSLFLNTTVTNSSQMELYTDASGKIGYGGYFNRKWFQGWLVTSHATQQSNGHKYQMAGTFSHSCCLCHIWYPHFSRKRIQFCAITSPWSL